MDISTALVIFILCYLIGSISFGRIIARFVAPKANLDQIEEEVSGTDLKYRLTGMGASVIGRVVGQKASGAISVLDVLKVAVPVLVIKTMFPGQYYHLVASLAGIMGHDWPIYYGFRGGRGMTGTYGSLLVIDPLGTITVALTGLVVGVVVFRNLIVFYFGTLWLLLPWFWFRTHDPVYVVYGLLLNIVFLLALIPDIRQILKFRKEMGDRFNTELSLQFTSLGRAFLKMKKFTR